MKIGPYEILGTLGRGGAGAVFRARGPSGAEVAVKVLLRLDERRRARFERERRLLGTFTAEDGFVPLLDAGSAPEGPYLVMPIVPGGTLRERLERGAFKLEEAVALGRSLAAALARAHGRGVVHRDLKPENVLFTAEGRPLIADLGLGKHFDPDAPGASQSVSLSRTGEARGTVGYMPPEQLEDARRVGPEADVFALGAILYECLAGKPAFSGENVVELLAHVSSGEKEPLASACPRAPGWLVAVVERAVATKASARFADGAALLDALVEERARPRARTRYVLGGGIVLVLSVATLALATLAAGGRPAPATAPDVRGPEPSAPPAVPLTPTKARSTRARAEAGEASAMVELGEALAEGRGVGRDEIEAVSWFRKAALAGEPRGMYRLGIMLEDGRGTANDMAEAALWYEKGAQAGHTNCMNNLGNMLLDGRGLARDEVAGVSWFRKAADAGNTAGMTNLGSAFAEGHGVAQDHVEAVSWYRKAADAGDAWGMSTLGIMYATGQGVARDEVEAVRLFRKAADAGEAVGMKNLAQMYEEGRGVAKDEDEAVRWYRKAAALGRQDAREALRRLGAE